MDSETYHSIAGGWLGTYYYTARTMLPVRFEASFVRQSGGEAVESGGERFAGSVIDDDGGHDYATVSRGIQQGTFVRFVKTYAPPEPGLFPVSYVGTMSGDGRTLTGHWKIALTESRRARAREIVGTWEARRIWTAVEGEDAQDAGAGRELVGAGSGR
ncbi:MAG: hypothetical protein H7Y38_02115 [Armatimonadetes bacterium]|nr:hypothetical protein [Armatimonadota bacterium]